MQEHRGNRLKVRSQKSKVKSQKTDDQRRIHLSDGGEKGGGYYYVYGPKEDDFC